MRTMKRILALPLFLIVFNLSAQQKPKLVVGIIVDQMRQEYLYRFQDKYGDDGFKRLMGEGFNFKNAHFNYVPTKTAPGHASVYTGSTPAIHGVIGNNWYNKEIKEEIYCAGDDSENTVGSDSDKGKMSPRNLLTTTISDEVRLSSQMRSKVVGISVKDRGAIFPAGHTGEAYWYDKKTGDFITSTYYMDKLPGWVRGFNEKKRADYFLSQSWEPVASLDDYWESIADDNKYEAGIEKDTPTFPYPLKKGEYWMVPETPFGNDIVAEMALEALEKTELGKDASTDVLAISFSSTDYIGHGFGPNSKEIEDTYIRLDRNLAQILAKLDEKVGKGNYTVFLTADHAVAEVPQYLIDSSVPAGYFDVSQVKGLNDSISEKFGEGQWIEDISNEQIFLNRAAVLNNNKDLHEVQNYTAHLLLEMKGIAKVYPAHLINGMDYNAGGIKGLLARGYNQKRSGDVLVVFEPGWMGPRSKGTTHGSAYTYDTHVPMLWYGAGVKKGESVGYKTITQIAPTLSMMLDVMLPSGATGQPLEELFVD